MQETGLEAGSLDVLVFGLWNNVSILDFKEICKVSS